MLEDIVRITQRVVVDNLVVSTQGNFSARDPATGYIAITPHDAPYSRLTAADLVIVDVNGNLVAGSLAPSFETPVHCTVYRKRPNVMAIAHTEPAYVNAFGAVNREILPVTTTAFKSSGGTIPIMPYQRSGSVEFAEQMLAVMRDRYAVVWANHGMLVVGPTIDAAYERSLAIEAGARTLHLALQIGDPSTLAGIKDPASVVA